MAALVSISENFGEAPLSCCKSETCNSTFGSVSTQIWEQLSRSSDIFSGENNMLEANFDAYVMSFRCLCHVMRNFGTYVMLSGIFGAE